MFIKEEVNHDHQKGKFYVYKGHLLYYLKPNYIFIGMVTGEDNVNKLQPGDTFAPYGSPRVFKGTISIGDDQ